MTIRPLLSGFTIIMIALALAGCETTASSYVAAGQLRDQVVEASCGQCQLGLDESGCDLAVRIDGEAYFVDGSKIDDHGDAHASDGFCNTIRHARVTGSVVDGRFHATEFELQPATDN